MGPNPIIYQIYVDAFARGSSNSSPGRRRGGDLEGVLERLDHVAALGADAIWMTPIFASPSDHGYNITDYFQVDPRLAPGGSADAARDLFAAVVDAAHRRGIAVLLDLPLNHVGHGYDLERAASPEPPRVRPPRTRQERGWTRDLKYLDHDHDPTREFLFGVARFWVERFGIDGYRYDYVHGVPNPFWEDLYEHLRALGADLFVVGEHWEDIGSPEENARDIASRFDGERGRCFDTLFDFPFQAAAAEAVGTGAAAHLAEVLMLCDRVYPRPACAMLDNHDTARSADWADRHPERLTLALQLLASRTGPISILYGTEVGLASGRSPRPKVDESSRIPMDWGALDGALLARARCILAARREHPVFAAGATLVRGGSKGFFYEVKEHEGRRGLVALNFAAAPVDAWPEALAGARGLESVCGGARLEWPIPGFGGGLYLLP